MKKTGEKSNMQAGKTKSKRKKIVFVCTGNTCRSPMAEFILKSELSRRGRRSEFTVTSAGLSVAEGDGLNPTAREALRVMRVKTGKFASKPLTLKTAESARLIVCMTESHREAITLSPLASESVKQKTVTLASLTGGNDVPDPYGKSLAEYLKTAEYLAYAADDIIAALDKIN